MNKTEIMTDDCFIDMLNFNPSVDKKITSPVKWRMKLLIHS